MLYLSRVENRKDNYCGAVDIDIVANRQLIPLQFTNGLYLRQVAMEDRLKHSSHALEARQKVGRYLSWSVKFFELSGQLAFCIGAAKTRASGDCRRCRARQ